MLSLPAHSTGEDVVPEKAVEGGDRMPEYEYLQTPDRTFQSFNEDEFNAPEEGEGEERRDAEKRPEGDRSYHSPIPNIPNPDIASSNVQIPVDPAHIVALQSFIENPATKCVELLDLLKGCEISELTPNFTGLRSADLRLSTTASSVLLMNHLIAVLNLQKQQETLLDAAQSEKIECHSARKRAVDAESLLSQAQEAIKLKDADLQRAFEEKQKMEEKMREEERIRAAEDKDKILELQNQVDVLKTEMNTEREKASERICKAEGNFSRLKKGIPDLISKVLGSKLVGDPYNDYVEALRTHWISDVAGSVFKRCMPNTPFPQFIANIVHDGTNEKADEMKHKLETLKINIYDEICNREDSSAEDILDLEFV